jgi:exopolysaccharide production negative regulator
MPIFSVSHIGSALAAFIVLTPAGVGGADQPPPYTSATEAYRQGASAMKSGEMGSAVPALEYAATRGVLGAQLKLARLYAKGHDVPKDDAKAFHYYQHIADQYADIPPSSPIAQYVGEAFCALGRYYVGGIPAMPLHPDPGYAVGLFRHAGAYFGDADAQYQLGRLYLTGSGVEKNQTIAANWLAMAARKQHPSAQAVLGEMLWRGEGVSQRQVRGLALLMLANENAKTGVEDAEWIGQRYKETVALADKATRKQAEAMVPALGGPRPAATAVKISPNGRAAPPPTRTLTKPAAPEPSLSAMEEPRLGPVDVMPPAAMGMSVGFGASESGMGGLQP